MCWSQHCCLSQLKYFFSILNAVAEKNDELDADWEVLFFVKFFSSDGLLLDILTSIREKEVLQLLKNGKRLDKSQVFISEKSKNLFKN